MGRKALMFKIAETGCGSVAKFDLHRGTSVNINNFFLDENITSRIEVEKLKSNIDDKEYFYVRIYSGNLNIGSVIYQSDFVIDIEERAYSKYFIRKAEDYDYK